MNCSMLKGAIVSRNYTIAMAADALGLSRSAFQRRLHGNQEFSRSEINTLADFLHLSGDEMLAIFFTEKVS